MSEVGGVPNNSVANIETAAASFALSCDNADIDSSPRHVRGGLSPVLALEVTAEWACLLRNGQARREQRAAERRAQRRREAKCERQRQRRGRRRQEREKLRAALMAATVAASCAATAAATAASKAADTCGYATKID